MRILVLLLGVFATLAVQAYRNDEAWGWYALVAFALFLTDFTLWEDQNDRRPGQVARPEEAGRV
jgi:hypothetical protein